MAKILSRLRALVLKPAFTAIGALAMIAAASPAAAQQIININALDSSGQQVLSLAPGTYSVSLIGTANGGAYNAWNPWGVTNCSSPGTTCTGWVDDFGITYDGLTTVYVNGLHYLSDTDALAANQAIIASDSATFSPDQQTGVTNSGGTIMFTLVAPTDVTFSIFDTPYYDNSGGISLSLSAVRGAVPEPSTWALMLMGFAGLGLAVRRNRRSLACAAA